LHKQIRRRRNINKLVAEPPDEQDDLHSLQDHMQRASSTLRNPKRAVKPKLQVKESVNYACYWLPSVRNGAGLEKLTQNSENTQSCFPLVALS